MEDNGLPCLDLLAATPQTLRGLTSEVTKTRAGSLRPTGSPSPRCWPTSRTARATAIACAVDRFLGEERPDFEPDAAQFFLDLYRNADPEDELDHFEEQRETNVEFLRSLPAEMAGRVATHREAGEITLAQMLHEWALHDLGHIRQVAELVRARKYLERAGPLGRSYQLKP